MTQYRIFNLAYCELLRRREVEQERYNRLLEQGKEGPIALHRLVKLDAEIDELHALILAEEKAI